MSDMQQSSGAYRSAQESQASKTSNDPSAFAAVKPNKKYVSFMEAHQFARTLSLHTRKEWRTYVRGGMPDKPKKPDSIPSHPDGIYKVKGWQGWKFWLGTADKGLLH